MDILVLSLAISLSSPSRERMKGEGLWRRE
jgi:hypothetical protein